MLKAKCHFLYIQATAARVFSLILMRRVARHDSEHVRNTLNKTATPRSSRVTCCRHVQRELVGPQLPAGRETKELQVVRTSDPPSRAFYNADTERSS